MNRKKAVFLILIACAVVLLVFLCLFFSKHYKMYQAAIIYQDFLDGKISAGSLDIIKIASPTGEPERRNATRYVMVDVTGDGIPELHIKSGSEYFIFTVKGDEMYEYVYFQTYGKEYFPLENGKFLCRVRRRHGYGDDYTYFELDNLGVLINKLEFSWEDCNDNFTYDENDKYIFDGSLCNCDEWYNKTREYLYMDAIGDDQIRNAVEWFRYCTRR